MLLPKFGTTFRPVLTCQGYIRIRIARSLLLLLSFLLAQVDARKLPDIHWHSGNRIFDISNTDHVKQASILDRVTILCPPPTSPDGPYEYSKLFMVSREGYDKCELRDEKQLGVCATPERHSSISLVFRDFSPLPSALTFEPGKSYFVITTSSGSLSGLNNTRGGLCEAKNMKLKFDIVSDNQHTGSSSSSSSRLKSDSAPQPILYVIHTSDQADDQTVAALNSDFVLEEGQEGDDVSFAPPKRTSSEWSNLALCLLITAILRHHLLRH